MVAPVSAASANTGAAAASSSNGLASASEQSDRFLKLLVAQLNNQDPMNPMDNAQMTSQMAQINTVSGIQQVNESIKALASQFASMQMLQGTSMIGHDVLTNGNTMTVNNGVGRASFELAGNADKVTVQISTPGGQILDTVELGSQSRGQVNFEWNASGYTGSAAPVFKVSASQTGRPVAASSMGRDTVVGVSHDGANMNLALKSGATVAYNAVKAIL